MMTIQKHKFKYIFLFIIFFLFSVKGFAANYYWVGGSGNWSDINHWRTVSGGTSLPSVVPGPTDNVFFDSNSGFTTASKSISVNVAANCHNITFSGSTVAPDLNGSNLELNIYGSSEWQTGMTVSIGSIYYRNTNTPKTIKSNGVINVSDVYFEEETSISLSDDFSVSRFLRHTAGTWNTNNYKVTSGMGYYGNSGTKPRTIDMGSSHVFITNSNSAFNADSSLLTLNAGTSHIHFSGYYSNLIPYAGQTYYNIGFENPLETGMLGSFQTGKVYYNRVEFKGGGIFYKDNQIKELIFTEGKKYILPASSTQTVTALFKAAASNCGEWISMSSSTSGIQAKLAVLSGGSVDVSRAILKDIQASGGAVFTAAYSLDNGNNTGWSFSSSSVQNLYWVGGSGNWNDKGHWSASSGGTGGYCLPGPKDNVFFDGNSGFSAADKTVALSSVAYAHDVTFAGSSVAPVLKEETIDMELNIYGSSEWQLGMEVKISGIFYRNSGEAKTIKSNGVFVNSRVQFGEESAISLLDDFYTLRLQQDAGVWNTNNYSVTLDEGYYLDASIKPKTVNMGSSDFYLSGNDSNFSANSRYLTVNSETSHIHFLGLNPVFRPSGGHVYYNISFENSLGNARFGNSQQSKVYFNRVEFKGNGNLVKDNQIKELIFTEGKKYTLDISSTQTVTSSFTATAPSCGGWISISSSTAGTQAKLIAASGVSIDVSRATLKDIQASGGAVFTADHSTDNGNNTGWTFPVSAVKNLYWIGGSGNWDDKNHWSAISGGAGGYCIPGPADNVFFDKNSGFSTDDKTVTLNENANCHHITFSGSVTACVLNGNNKDLNIYGSSEWQNEMNINVSRIYYRNKNETKTIKSNGVVMREVFFEEETSINLLDDFYTLGKLTHNAGTWNTNNHKVTLKSGYEGDTGILPRTINMGSSEFYINSGPFSADSSLLTLNSGTSHIRFLSYSYVALNPYEGQIYYNVSFEGSAGSLGKTQTGKTYYNRVEFKGDGSLIKDNQIKELILTAGKNYTLEVGKTQTVTDQLYASGNSCFVLFLKSSVPGTKANLNVMGGSTGFDFANVKDINASGETLNFGSKSTNVENNFNMTFDPYDPSAFSGFAGQDWSHAKFKNNDPDSYTLSSAGFYGNPYTTYKWSKINDPAHTGTIATGSTLDMRSFGYGTYHIKVEYSAPGSPDYCVVEESIMVKSFVPSMINPGLPIRNY